MSENADVHPILRARPVYNYLYGSIDESLLNTSVDSAMESADASAVLKEGDQDSLVGEALVPTDNEEEERMHPRGDDDYEHLLLSTGGVHAFISKQQQFPPSLKHRGWFGRCGGGSDDGSTNPTVVLLSTLCGIIFLLACSMMLLLLPERNATAATAGLPASEMAFRMPFTRVDREAYGDPVDGFLRTDLFHPSLLYQGTDPSRIFVFPFPTGAFWVNLVLPPTADRGISYPIVAYPYAYKWSDTMLQVSYPAAHRHLTKKSIHDYFFPDLTFTCNQTITRRQITSFDPLSVTLTFETSNKGLLSLYVVQGSPYVTMELGSVLPIIRALSTFESFDCPTGNDATGLAADTTSSDSGNTRGRSLIKDSVCVDETKSGGGGGGARMRTLRGVQFILKSAEGWSWYIFTSEPVVLMFDTLVRTTVRASEPYNGVFRLAIIPETDRTGEELAESSGVQQLIDHASVYPVSGEVSWTFSGVGEELSTLPLATTAVTAALEASQSDGTGKKPTRVGTIAIKFETKTFTPVTSAIAPKPVLMLALPHHAKSLPTSLQLSPETFDLTFNTIKGPMTPILRQSWSYDVPLVSPGFDNDSGSDPQQDFRDPVLRNLLKENLVRDLTLALPVPAEDIYGYGKQVARLAQLALIAEKLARAEERATMANETDYATDGDSMIEILTRATQLLRNALKNLLLDNISDALVYDANLGGLVTIRGLMDTGSDFGNGRYNDHHFHYGYLLYASAIMGKLDSSFVDQHGDQVDAILFDVAHDTNLDSRRPGEGAFFPASRHKSWFDEHSFASGLFPFGNGKSQESSSEAVNCYYGAYLWSLVRNGGAEDPESDVSPQTDFTRLLMSTEIRGAQNYWQMLPPSLAENEESVSAYPATFAENLMVGNVGMLDVVCSTWFGTQELYVHMINLIPVTAATGELFHQEYAAVEYASVLAPLGEVETAWRGFVVADQAITDPKSAWDEAQRLFSPQLDGGLSKTQVLFFVATRKGFLSGTNFSSSTSTYHLPTRNHQESSQRNSDPQHSPSKTTKPESSNACSAHSKCAALGLTGICCPTPVGVMLDCC